MLWFDVPLLTRGATTPMPTQVTRVTKGHASELTSFGVADIQWARREQLENHKVFG
jgi:hypothetical protein